MLSSVNSYAALYNNISGENYLELGLAKSKALGNDAYIPNATIGGFSYRKQVPFQITLGFLNKDVSRLQNGKLQELKNFFYLGPQYIQKYRLETGVYSEIGIAVLTGNLGYRTSQTSSSAFRDGMFFGIQPKVKLTFHLHRELSLVFDYHYILMSSNLDDGGSDIGPSFGAGLRYKLDF